MKFRYLDGLRGIAALVVVLNHLAFIYMPLAINGLGLRHGLGPLIHNTPLYLFVDGDLAVCLFFALSGIVLSAKFFRTRDRSMVAQSAAKRYFRLGIPVFGSVMLAYGLMSLGLMHNIEVGKMVSPWWWHFWEFTPNIQDAVWQGLYGAFLTEQNSYNPVLWTMRYEFIGSFLVFGTLALAGSLRNRWIIYAVLMIFFLQTYYLAFLLGLALCDYYYSGRRRLLEVLGRGLWMPLLGAALVIGSYPITNAKGTMFEHVALPVVGAFFPVLAHTMGAIGILLAIFASPLLRRGLEWRPVQFLGRISFPLYLLHLPILGSYTSAFFLSLTGQFGTKVAAAITLVPTLVLVVTVAYLYARYVDEPAIRLSGKVFGWWFDPSAKRGATQQPQYLPKPEPVSQAQAPAGASAMVQLEP